MSDDRLLNELIIEQELLFETNFLLKKKESLNKLLISSLNETNDYLNKILLNIIQRQNRFFNYFFEERDRYIERQTFENVVNQIISNENLLIDKLKRIYVQLNPRKRREKKTLISERINHRLIDENGQDLFTNQLDPFNDQILKIYWRSMSSNNLYKKSHFINIRTSSTDTYLTNNINKFSLFNHCSTNIHSHFPKLEKIKRIDPN